MPHTTSATDRAANLRRVYTGESRQQSRNEIRRIPSSGSFHVSHDIYRLLGPSSAVDPSLCELPEASLLRGSVIPPAHSEDQEVLEYCILRHLLNTRRLSDEGEQHSQIDDPTRPVRSVTPRDNEILISLHEGFHGPFLMRLVTGRYNSGEKEWAEDGMPGLRLFRVKNDVIIYMIDQLGRALQARAVVRGVPQRHWKILRAHVEHLLAHGLTLCDPFRALPGIARDQGAQNFSVTPTEARAIANVRKAQSECDRSARLSSHVLRRIALLGPNYQMLSWSMDRPLPDLELDLKVASPVAEVARHLLHPVAGFVHVCMAPDSMRKASARSVYIGKSGQRYGLLDSDRRDYRFATLSIRPARFSDDGRQADFDRTQW